MHGFGKTHKKFTVNDVHVDYKDFDITFGLYFPMDNSTRNWVHNLETSLMFTDLG